MTQLQVTLPPALEHWIDTRLAEGRYANADDYLRDLIRRDQAGASDETTWLRELIEEGNASGVIEKDAKAVLREIMAECPARRG